MVRYANRTLADLFRGENPGSLRYNYKMSRNYAISLRRYTRRGSGVAASNTLSKSRLLIARAKNDDDSDETNKRLPT